MEGLDDVDSEVSVHSDVGVLDHEDSGVEASVVLEEEDFSKVG